MATSVPLFRTNKAVDVYRVAVSRGPVVWIHALVNINIPERHPRTESLLCNLYALVSEL